MQTLDDLETWEGMVEHITYKNEETGFAVLRLINESRQTIIAVGSLASIQEGETLLCHGKWKMDKRYGKQLEVVYFENRMPQTRSGVERYLSSGSIKGIGKVMAHRIVAHFGEDALRILDEEPQRLREVQGIGKKTWEKIVAGWQQQHSMRRVVIWLQQFGVSPAFAQRIFNAYGEQSEATVSENPYRLAEEVIGIGFKTADTIAQKMGIGLDSSQRIQAAVEYRINECAQQGHTCYPLSMLLEETAEMLSLHPERIKEDLAGLVQAKRIVIQTLPLLDTTDQLESFVWLTSYYNMEQRVARYLEQMLAEAQPPPPHKNLEIAQLHTIAHTMGITLERQQEEAVWQSSHQPAHIITGGPGTGKSTIIKVLVRWLSVQNKKFALAAPTGRAAKRLAEITQHDASTLHSLLGFTAFRRQTGQGGSPVILAADVLIVDEMSMVDTALMHAVVCALGEKTRLVLVGDIDQLPSVGAGNVLRDLIASKRVPMTRLTEIFRQAQSSHIITNAHRINQGLSISTKIDRQSDFFFIPEDLPERIQETLLGLLGGRLHKTYGWDMLRDVQVLSPMNRGVLGTIRLNELIQQRLNPITPDTKMLERANTRFSVGDKVLQTKNNYDKGVYNGDIGYIEAVDTEERSLLVRVDQQLVEYTAEDWHELELAYAISIHKYQGSECPCVLIPLHWSHYRLLSRNLLYTAVTRGKKLVILIGMERALYQAIDNAQESNRYTGLRQALSGYTDLGFPPIVLIPLPPPMYAAVP